MIDIDKYTGVDFLSLHNWRPNGISLPSRERVELELSRAVYINDIRLCLDIIYYPDLLGTALNKYGICYSWDFSSYICRCIEHRLTEQYKMLKLWLANQHDSIMYTKYPLLIRPYFVDKMDKHMLEQVGIELGMYDPGICKKFYVYDPTENIRGEYFGYRHTRHLLYYGTDQDREALYKRIKDYGIDCTMDAVKDHNRLYLNSHTNIRIFEMD